MLKDLLNEIRRGFKRKETAEDDPDVSPAHSDAAEREAFAKGDAATRARLLSALQMRLNTADGEVQEWCRLGDWLLQLDQADTAQNAFRRALQLHTLHARSHEGLGLALLRNGQLEEAFLRLETANKLDPQNAEILVHWGLVDLALGKYALAAGRFESAIERDPNNHHAWHNLGIASIKQGLVSQGLEQFRRALALRPTFAAAHANLALASVKSGRLDEALAAAQQTTTLAPQLANSWRVLAEVHRCRGELSPARHAALQAQTLDPQQSATCLELGLQDGLIGDFASAGERFEEALRLDHTSAEAQLAMAEWHLAQGDWARGWPLYEGRRRTNPSPIRPVPYLEWQGEALEDEVLLIHAEQGLGDIILFASCLPDLIQRGATLVVEVPDRLRRLFQRSFPQVTVITFGGERDLTPWSPEIEALAITRHIPIGSLPRWLRQRDSDFAATAPYLRAAPEDTTAWRERLHGLGPLVGLAWRGGLPTTGGAMRSMNPDEMVEHLHLPAEVRYVSLQYGAADAELKAFAARSSVLIHPGAGPDADLDDMAALTAACDVIITVCSTQAHLTGALGRRGVVIAPAGANWRYASTGDVSRWYPSLHVRRRSPEHADWQSTLHATGEWVRAQMAV